MTLGLPDKPPDDIEFRESVDDETCPECGWDREDGVQDPQRAYNSRVLYAVERGEQSPFGAMGGAILLAYYWKCHKCDTNFTTEEEVTSIGAAG